MAEKITIARKILDLLIEYYKDQPSAKFALDEASCKIVGTISPDALYPPTGYRMTRQAQITNRPEGAPKGDYECIQYECNVGYFPKTTLQEENPLKRPVQFGGLFGKRKKNKK